MLQPYIGSATALSDYYYYNGKNNLLVNEKRRCRDG